MLHCHQSDTRQSGVPGKQNILCRMDPERNSRTTTNMLPKYEEIFHKALIDAQIAVLTGDYAPDGYHDTRNVSTPGWRTRRVGRCWKISCLSR